MSDDNALPNKAAETDSTPPPIAQPDHLAPDPTATPAPADSPNLVLPPRSLTASDDSSFLGPLFTTLARSIHWNYYFAVAEGFIREDLSWVPAMSRNDHRQRYKPGSQATLAPILPTAYFHNHHGQ